VIKRAVAVPVSIDPARITRCSGHIRIDADLVIQKHADYQALSRADARTRTGDPFITSEVLYQLSYVGVSRAFADFACSWRGFWLPRGCKILVGRCCGQA
jgi:hypothetical protein